MNDRIAELEAWCIARLAELRPRIGLDETVVGVQFTNRPQEIAVELVQQMADAGLGALIGQIDPRPYVSARLTTALLWQVLRQLGISEASPTQPPTVADRWSEARSPSDWAKAFKLSVDTLKRRIKKGTLRVQVLHSKSWRVHEDDLPKPGTSPQ